MNDDLALFDQEYQQWQNEQKNVAYGDGGQHLITPQLFYADGSPAQVAAPAVKRAAPRQKPVENTLVIKIKNSKKEDRKCFLYARKGTTGLITVGAFRAVDDVAVSGTYETSLEVVHFDDNIESFLSDIQGGKKAFQIGWMNVTVQPVTGTYDTNGLLFTGKIESNGELVTEKRLHGNTYGSPTAFLSNRMEMNLAQRGQNIDVTANRALELLVPAGSTLILSFSMSNNMDLTKSFEIATR